VATAGARPARIVVRLRSRDARRRKYRFACLHGVTREVEFGGTLTSATLPVAARSVQSCGFGIRFGSTHFVDGRAASVEGEVTLEETRS